MAARAVHWHEGVFLQPHHFQAEHRYLTGRMHRALSWPVHHSWGLRSVQIDTDALANSRRRLPRLALELPVALSGR